MRISGWFGALQLNFNVALAVIRNNKTEDNVMRHVRIAAQALDLLAAVPPHCPGHATLAKTHLKVTRLMAKRPHLRECHTFYGKERFGVAFTERLEFFKPFGKFKSQISGANKRIYDGRLAESRIC